MRMMVHGVKRMSVAAITVAIVLVATGCTPTGDPTEEIETGTSLKLPEFNTYPGVRVIANLDYGVDAKKPPLLDVCLPKALPVADPAAVKPRAAVLWIHGGSWARGDKANKSSRGICQWLAGQGFVGISVNYRLAPASVFPVQIDDVRAALTWIREPAQAERFNIDPTLIGAFGGSAGGNLAALLGVHGSGALDEGTRVKAVAELSGPTDLTDEGRFLGGLTPSFEKVQRTYLACKTLADCPHARDASPLYWVDPTDPPFFVANSTNEMIPIQQSEEFVRILRESGIEAEFVSVEGPLHATGMFDSAMRVRVADFFRANLTNEVPGVVQ